MERLKVGDRVMQSGFKWKGEGDRFGEVVETYNGAPSALDPGVPLVAVKWDDTGEVQRGYIDGVSLRRYITVPTMWIPDGKEAKGS